MSVRWVPKRLTPDLKEHREDVCETFLRRYKADEDGCLRCIFIGDKCWYIARVVAFIFAEIKEAPYYSMDQNGWTDRRRNGVNR